MKILIVEDDFTSRTMLYRLLNKSGKISIAVDGEEAVMEFTKALEEDSPFDLVCLDIMLPKKDGQSVLKEIRKIEENRGIYGLEGAKIIMITALDDSKNIIEAFRSQCEGYLSKPFSKEKLFRSIKNLGIDL